LSQAIYTECQLYQQCSIDVSSQVISDSSVQTEDNAMSVFKSTLRSMLPLNFFVLPLINSD